MKTNKNDNTMKASRIALTIAACLLGFVGMAQNTVVEGTNLNIGEGNTLTSDAIGMRGHAIGRSNIVESHNALAVGYGDTINELCPNSMAFGTSNRIGGNSSIAIGQDVKVMGEYSLGIGRYLKALGQNDCMVVGNGFYSSGANPKRFLENQYSHSLMVGFKSIKPTLTVGPSPNNYPTGDTLGKTGRVAIGDIPVPNIEAKLHIRSDWGEEASIILESKDPSSNTFIRLKDGYHGIVVDDEGEMTIRSMGAQGLGSLVLQGRVGINITNESDAYALAVNGGILTNEVFIKNVDEWFDHVFSEGYNLMPLNDLRRYVDENGHLPEVPSETEVMHKGYNMTEMQGILLKKIEELTLYTMKQQEEIEALKQTLKDLTGK